MVKSVNPEAEQKVGQDSERLRSIARAQVEWLRHLCQTVVDSWAQEPKMREKVAVGIRRRKSTR
jgi:hypothetical protein